MFLPISTFVYDMLQEILDIFNEIDLYILRLCEIYLIYYPNLEPNNSYTCLIDIMKFWLEERGKTTDHLHNLGYSYRKNQGFLWEDIM